MMEEERPHRALPAKDEASATLLVASVRTRSPFERSNEAELAQSRMIVAFEVRDKDLAS